MNKIKDILCGTLGIVGLVVWYLIGAIMMFTPLVFLEDLSFWISLLIIIAILYIPFIGDITQFIIWLWSFVVVVSEPIDGWSIAYFVVCALYVFTTLLPIVINTFAYIVASIVSLFANRRNTSQHSQLTLFEGSDDCE